MSRYDQLQMFLAAGAGRPITLTFDQVKLLVPGIAPSHAIHPAWWNNNDPSHSHCRSWSAAGFEAQADLRARLVTFAPLS